MRACACGRAGCARRCSRSSFGAVDHAARRGHWNTRLLRWTFSNNGALPLRLCLRDCARAEQASGELLRSRTQKADDTGVDEWVCTGEAEAKEKKEKKDRRRRYV